MFPRCFAWLAAPVPTPLYKHRRSAMASMGLGRTEFNSLLVGHGD